LEAPALVALSAGDLVNIVTSGGAAKAQPANATDGTKPADGFVRYACALGATALVFGPGLHDALSGLTPGATYFLDTTNGQITATPPSGAGNLLQSIGKAVSSSALLFSPSAGLVL
jgi:hypothetical protein